MDKQANTENVAVPFDDLLSFVSSHKEINITASTLSVPLPLREEFYEFVHRVQVALLDDIVGEDAKQVIEAAQSLSAVRESLIAGSDLVELKLPDALEALLLDTKSALAKPAFGIVLDALQNGHDNERLVDAAYLVLPGYREAMFRNAYEMWAYFQIVLALNPVRFWEVFSPDTVEVRAVPSGSVTVGAQITSPERRIPEAVFETRSGSVYAMKSEVARELDFYSIKILRRRDFSAGGNTVDQIAHRVLLLYQIPSIEEIPLLADRDKPAVLPPDLMCEFLLPSEMSRSTYVSQFVDRINAVRSMRPMQVLTFDECGEFPEGMLDDVAVAPIQRSIVGFSTKKLDEIASLLTQ